MNCSHCLDFHALSGAPACALKALGGIVARLWRMTIDALAQLG